MDGRIRELGIADYDRLLALWRRSEGVVLRDADSREAIARFLAHNPGLSFVLEEDGQILGAVLGGTDGRRGYLHHLAVDAGHRRRGFGRALASRAAEALVARGIEKCHVMVLRTNAAARSFWASAGWEERADLVLMSRTAGGRDASSRPSPV